MRRFDEGQLRADCAAAGITEEVAEIVVLRMRDDLLFNVIARQMDPPMPPATVRSHFTRATDRLRRYYEMRAEAVTVAGLEGAMEGGGLSLVEYARVIFRGVQGNAVPSGMSPIERLPSAKRLTLDDVVEVCGQANSRRGA